MTEVGFYHLRTTPLERALPRLLDKAVQRGMRVVVLADSTERVQQLDMALWTYDPASFLPHGTAADGADDRQPIFLTATQGNPNGATLLVLVDGMDADDLGSYQRCLDVFDGNDEGAVAAARERWRARKAAGHVLAYWQQDDAGNWARKQ
ncbi:MAG: DNA polymerase III subunit chi [Alphaproteobacteria bacterium]|nr:DNA polymerase III subunit chi [Alphaproteobacteria bacterium]